MGSAFSGPTAFNFLGFTKQATDVLRASPLLLVVLLVVLLANVSLGLLAYYIHIVTNKPYAKPKPVKDAPKK